MPRAQVKILSKHLHSRFFSASSGLIDGKRLSKLLEQSVKGEVEAFYSKYRHFPTLALIDIGEHPQSKSYLSSKKKACERVGIQALYHQFDSSIQSTEILEQIAQLNINPAVDGILVQFPLPSHLKQLELIQAIDPIKDVDGLHPLNVGKLAMSTREPREFVIPCTPRGILYALTASHVEIEGKVVCIIGRSDLVGNPIAHLLKQHNATIIQCHSYTKNLAQLVQLADIVIAVAGSPELIKANWVRQNAVVIDVGLNYIEDQTLKKGYRIAGDVESAKIHDRASLVTPVPGGIGPLTIAMLLQNVVDAAKRLRQ